MTHKYKLGDLVTLRKSPRVGRPYRGKTYPIESLDAAVQNGEPCYIIAHEGEHILIPEGMIADRVPTEKVVITTDGYKTTTARLYRDKELVRTAVSNCHPTDTFNFKQGATIAYARLMDIPINEPQKPKPRFEEGQYVTITGRYGHNLIPGSTAKVAKAGIASDLHEPSYLCVGLSRSATGRIMSLEQILYESDLAPL